MNFWDKIWRICWATDQQDSSTVWIIQRLKDRIDRSTSGTFWRRNRHEGSVNWMLSLQCALCVKSEMHSGHVGANEYNQVCRWYDKLIIRQMRKHLMEIWIRTFEDMLKLKNRLIKRINRSVYLEKSKITENIYICYLF